MFKQFSTGACIAAALLGAHAFAADPTGNKLEAAFKRADPDNDGTLTRDEARSMPRVAKHFDAIDTDKDGTVSLQEIRVSMKKVGKEMHDRAAERFKGADKDSSGTLTKEEAKTLARVSRNFDAIDADKDGTVSEKEIHAYMKMRHSKK